MHGMRELLIDSQEFLNSTTPTMAIQDLPVPEDLEAAEGSATLAVLTMAFLLGLAMMVGQVLERNRVDWMSEAGAALIMGIVVGLILNIANISTAYEDVFRFNTDFFFIALLPPIIFDAGFNLDVVPFFSNIGAICTLAFAGTAISTAVIAVFMYLVGAIGIAYPITFFHACVFGAIISATDPVTVLAVFGRLHADKDLNALVLGEAVINDAVAIVLYRVIMTFDEQPVTLAGLAYGVWQFAYIFIGSLALGVACGVVAAVLFKTQYFRNEHTPVEAALVIIIAYCSFYVTDGIGLSGIVSIMFCGVVMAKYVRPNLSDTTSDRVGAFFRVIATLAETFVFIYIGMSLFTERQAWDQGLTWSFMILCLAALAASRAANVYPLAAAINLLRPEELRITPRFKFMLWFSGLRGAMAFALAMLARSKLGAAGDVIFTTTFFMILITVLINGGASTFLIGKLELREVPTSPPPGDSQLLGTGQWSGGMDEVTNNRDSVYLTPLDVEFASPPSPSASTRGASSRGPLSTHTATPGTSSGSAFIDRIYDFQRAGLTESFKLVDETLSSVLLPESQQGLVSPGGEGSQHGASGRRAEAERRRGRSPLGGTPRPASLGGGFTAFELDES